MCYVTRFGLPAFTTSGEDTFTETGNRPGKDSTGLVAGHAYTLVAAKMTSKGDRLVKLRCVREWVICVICVIWVDTLIATTHRQLCYLCA
jgi:hypothetical protein